MLGGETLINAPLEEDNIPVVGAQAKVLAVPKADKKTVDPRQTVEVAGLIVTVGIGNIVMERVCVWLWHPVFPPITEYTDEAVGVIITLLPAVVFNPLFPPHKYCVAPDTEIDLFPPGQTLAEVWDKVKLGLGIIEKKAIVVPWQEPLDPTSVAVARGEKLPEIVTGKHGITGPFGVLVE